MTKALYRRLSLTFGFITLFDHANYWADYFTRAKDKARFLQQISTFPCYGDPALTVLRCGEGGEEQSLTIK
jgi:hypothetical protein